MANYNVQLEELEHTVKLLLTAVGSARNRVRLRGTTLSNVTDAIDTINVLVSHLNSKTQMVPKLASTMASTTPKHVSARVSATTLLINRTKGNASLWILRAPSGKTMKRFVPNNVIHRRVPMVDGTTTLILAISWTLQPEQTDLVPFLL